MGRVGLQDSKDGGSTHEPAGWKRRFSWPRRLLTGGQVNASVPMLRTRAGPWWRRGQADQSCRRIPKSCLCCELPGALNNSTAVKTSSCKRLMPTWTAHRGNQDLLATYRKRRRQQIDAAVGIWRRRRNNDESPAGNTFAPSWFGRLWFFRWHTLVFLFLSLLLLFYCLLLFFSTELQPVPVRLVAVVAASPSVQKTNKWTQHFAADRNTGSQTTEDG